MGLGGPPAVGEYVGPYRIEGRLGGGGMGHVFKAVHPDRGPVALKMVKEDLATDTSFRKRFTREARIAQELEHPHIVPALDSGEYRGIPYLVQEFVAGGSLEERIKERGRLDIATTVTLSTQIASALDALHEFARRVQATLVHRDVKPGNILLDEHGDAYLTDFGLAKDSRGTVLTKYAQAVGNPDYMAPEQIRNSEVGAQTDVYALGCVMYECLCGAPPFADRRRVLWAQLHDDPPNLCERRADLPTDVGAVILGALDKDPARRRQSAGELARMLQAAARV